MLVVLAVVQLYGELVLKFKNHATVNHEGNNFCLILCGFSAHLEVPSSYLSAPLLITETSKDLVL